MEKVLLNQEEIEALENALETLGDPASVIHWHATSGLWEGKREPLNDIDLDAVIRALYVGYELEKSPEDMLRIYYAKLEVPYERTIVINTLDALNVYIRGIN